MSTDAYFSHSWIQPARPMVPDGQRTVRLLRATLANIDQACEYHLQAVGLGLANLGSARKAAENLRRRYQEQRAPFASELAALGARSTEGTIAMPTDGSARSVIPEDHDTL